jgi:DNA-binding transcriptional ArsR family regulator
MPIVLDLSAVDRKPVRFAASAMVELGWAWHVLVAADHHPDRAAWAAAVRARLAPELLGDLDEWSFLVRAVRASVFTGPGGSWAAELAAVRRLRAAELLRPLLRVRGKPASADSGVLALARARGAVRVVSTILDQPERAAATLGGILRRCWVEFFAEEWRRVGPELRAAARIRSRLSTRDGWRSAVSGLSNAIVVDGSRIVIDKVQSKRVDVAARGLVLVPTAFGAPHVYVADEPGRPVVVHYPLPAPDRAADSRLTMRRLAALAHPARLEVCRAIAVEPRSAREIARLWGLAEPAVTKHLSVLRAAGLVRSERVGHFVRYTVDDAAIGVLGTDLLDVLRR